MCVESWRQQSNTGPDSGSFSEPDWNGLFQRNRRMFELFSGSEDGSEVLDGQNQETWTSENISYQWALTQMFWEPLQNRVSRVHPWPVTSRVWGCGSADVTTSRCLEAFWSAVDAGSLWTIGRTPGGAERSAFCCCSVAKRGIKAFLTFVDLWCSAVMTSLTVLESWWPHGGCGGGGHQKIWWCDSLTRSV